MEENDVEDPSGMVFNEMIDGVKSDIESLFDEGLA